jgi:hypothetical protein
MLPIVALLAWPVISYSQYVTRTGGTIGWNLLYGAVIPNIPAGFVIWAGLRGMRLSQWERAVACVPAREAGYLSVLRTMFGVWPGLVRSPLRAAMSAVLLYLGHVLQAVAVVLLGTVILLAPGDSRSILGGDALTVLLGALVLAVLMMLAGAGLRGLGRLASRQSLEAQVRRDRRPPVLFLRAFKDDQAILPRGGILHCVLRGEFSRRRLDHVLVEEFSRFGPVVALGLPGQRAMPFGAARIYVRHEDWRAKVLELATRSAHIVLVADAGAGVDWEIETMLSPPFRAKTLFVATESLGDLRVSARLRGQIWTDNLACLIGAFQDDESRTVLLSLRRPCPEGYIVALQAFFQRSSSKFEA